jgi:hypothetical protein
VLQRDLEILAHEEERRGEALGRLRAHAITRSGFGESAAQELGGLWLVPLISVQAPEEDQCFGESVALACRTKCFFEQGMCSR